MVFAGIGAIGFAVGLPVLGIVFAAFALAAAFLNAAFDFCRGCHMYLFIQRIRPAAVRQAAQGGFSVMSRSDALVDADCVKAASARPAPSSSR